jgi:hypothetical protein
MVNILNIPFIELKIAIDIENLLKEYHSIIKHYELKKYHSNYWPVRQKYAKSWSGISLMSSDGGLYTDMYEGSIGAPKETELLAKCPTFKKLLTQLQCTSRARILNIGPKKSLVWHSHVLEHGTPPNILTIQVPLIMPKEFEYCVINKDEFAWYKRFFSPKRFKTLTTKKLEVGKAYVFNSYHYHNVYNYSNENRVVLMFYLDLNNPYVNNLLNKSIKA